MAAVDQHPSHSVLEAYALGRLDDACFADVEAHVSGCPLCQQVVIEVPDDAFTQLLRSCCWPRAGS